jgi:hypothetical protein
VPSFGKFSGSKVQCFIAYMCYYLVELKICIGCGSGSKILVCYMSTWSQELLALNFGFLCLYFDFPMRSGYQGLLRLHGTYFAVSFCVYFDGDLERSKEVSSV